MARTWPVTRRKKLMLAAFDAIARPVAALVLRSTPATGEVKSILVLELWHIGDVVLATAALQRLREMYPSARLTLLAKPHAVELLQGSGLTDEIITFDFPWTAMSGKYQPGRYDRDAIAGIVKRLRDGKFDLSVDCRMDLRSNVLTRAARAARRVGYDFGGGGFLLTDAVPPGPADRHKVDDWMALLDQLSGSSGDRDRIYEPRLAVSADERRDADALLDSYGVERGETIVAIHAGGSYASKRWPSEAFAEVGRSLASEHGVRLLAFIDPDGSGSDMQLGGNAIFIRPTIREMMSLLTHCDMLLCNDSGPMHIATAVGVPVVAVFRTGNPQAYGPQGIGNTVVGRGAPWERTTDIAVEDVEAAAHDQVRSILARGSRSRSSTE